MRRPIPEPFIVVFFGLTGSGKSYLAGRWAGKHGVPYLNSDKVRKQIAGVAPESRHQVPFNEGLYSPEMTARTYAEMIKRAAAHRDEPDFTGAVLDGSYGRSGQRRDVVAAFKDACRVVFIYCYCSEKVTRHRFNLRAADDEAVSDGRWEIYTGQKRFFTVPGRIDGARLVKLDTDKPVETLVGIVDDVLSDSP